jgi:hypothetical protein
MGEPSWVATGQEIEQQHAQTIAKRKRLRQQRRLQNHNTDLVFDVFGSVGVFQRIERLLKVDVRRRNTRDHQRLAVATEGVLKQPRDFAVAKRHMRALRQHKQQNIRKRTTRASNTPNKAKAKKPCVLLRDLARGITKRRDDVAKREQASIDVNALFHSCTGCARAFQTFRACHKNRSL